MLRFQMHFTKKNRDTLWKRILKGKLWRSKAKADAYSIGESGITSAAWSLVSMRWKVKNHMTEKYQSLRHSLHWNLKVFHLNTRRLEWIWIRLEGVIKKLRPCMVYRTLITYTDLFVTVTQNMRQESSHGWLQGFREFRGSRPIPSPCSSITCIFEHLIYTPGLLTCYRAICHCHKKQNRQTQRAAEQLLLMNSHKISVSVADWTS